MMKRILLLYTLPICCLIGCHEKEDLYEIGKGDAVELTAVDATVYGSEATRAAALDKYNYVGRSQFIDADSMTLTTIKRTNRPIDGFYYHGIVYNHVVGAGQTSGGWNRDEEKGGTKANPNQIPERIYWSDAVNPHTYIGYSVPQQEDGVTFDWNMQNTYDATAAAGIDTYYGSLGDPTVPQSADGSTGYIDYTNIANETPVPDDPNKPNQALSYKSGNEKIKHDDLLLTYDENKVAETGGSVAKLYYHHALANVRVVVKISGFSATSESADALSVVENMVLKDMLTMYKWKQQSYGAEALNETYDQPKLNSIYTNLPTGHSVPTWDQKKDTHLWIPRKDGTGTGVGKQFVFYGLAVPTTMTARSLNLQFNVKYQDPMDPWTGADKKTPNMKDHTYTATMPQDIVFRAGWCTTINITLNHNNEKMTVGAEYMDWQFVPTPDEGELKKNSTFVSHTDRNKVTIFGDDKATVDDATWLYIDTENDYDTHKNALRDIYGHYGTPDDPFIISTADQLVSFAYEVKGNLRKAQTKYYNVATKQEQELVADAPFDFTGYYIKLDADITMQMSADIRHDADGFYTLNSDGSKNHSVNTEGKGVTWPGIGEPGKPFNGVFMGGERHINKLYGDHFFHTLGLSAVVDKLNFDNVIELLGCGVVAHENNGLICSCFLEGDVTETADAGTSYTGSIVGTNNSFIIACAHVGKVTGYGKVGGLVGLNNGTVMASYHSGVVEAKDASNANVATNAHPTVGEYSDGTGSTNRSIMFSCYYDCDIFHDSRTLVPGKLGYPLSKAMMQSNTFVREDTGSPSFLFDSNGNYSGQGPILREIAEEIVKKNHRNEYTDEQISQMTDQALIAIILPADALSEDVYEVFEHHFSLNTALRVFRYWLTRIREGMKDKTETATIETNCHTFNKHQIEFLYNHYTDQHVFRYVPAAYPKTQ